MVQANRLNYTCFKIEGNIKKTISAVINKYFTPQKINKQTYINKYIFYATRKQIKMNKSII